MAVRFFPDVRGWMALSAVGFGFDHLDEVGVGDGLPSPARRLAKMLSGDGFVFEDFLFEAHWASVPSL